MVIGAPTVRTQDYWVRADLRKQINAVQEAIRAVSFWSGASVPTIIIDLPEGALSALRLSPTEFAREMRVAAALLWSSRGELSQSKAADIASTSRAKFIDELGCRPIPVVQVTADELQDEIERE